ncbi:MAG: SRPBCC domain-containing protein [Acidobacteriota bacterium]
MNTKHRALALTGIIMATALLGHKIIHTEIVIPAMPENVWPVLTDAPGYSSWNPVMVEVEGEYREGAKLTYRVRETSGKESTMTSKVIRLVERRELRQFGGIRGILTFEHRWILEPVDGGTRVTQHEEYRGVGVWFWDASWVEPAYSRANEALREKVLEATGA